MTSRQVPSKKAYAGASIEGRGQRRPGPERKEPIQKSSARLGKFLRAWQIKGKRTVGCHSNATHLRRSIPGKTSLQGFHWEETSKIGVRLSRSRICRRKLRRS